jgi:hypothetical protein
MRELESNFKFALSHTVELFYHIFIHRNKFAIKSSFCSTVIAWRWVVLGSD